MRLAVGVLLFTTMISCSLNQKWQDRRAADAKAKEQARAQAEAIQMFDWKGDNLTGSMAVKIVLSEQKAYLYRGGQEAGWTYLASGTASHPSPTGTFRVIEKKADKSSNLYGIIVNSAGNVVDWDAKAGRESVPRGGRFIGAPMPYWMRLTSRGVGMHAGAIPQPGYPASHGCIRLPKEMAAKLFEVVKVGTPVTITGRAPQG
jgi:lipoprotein-anchoring transpeptidase ErfK/SrfK